RLRVSNGILYHLRSYLPKKIRLVTYFYFIRICMYYCLLIYGTASPCFLKRIVTLQKRCVRQVENVNYLAHTKPIFHSNALLLLNDLYTSKLIRAIVSTNQNTEIVNLCNLRTYTPGFANLRTREKYVVPFAPRKYSEQSLTVIAPKLLNLHESLFATQNQCHVKRIIRSKLLETYT